MISITEIQERAVYRLSMDEHTATLYGMLLIVIAHGYDKLAATLARDIAHAQRTRYGR